MAFRGTNVQVDDALIEFAEQEGKHELAEKLRVVNESDGIRGAAKKLGVAHGGLATSIKRLKIRAAKQGYSPEHDMTHTVPDGYHVKGVSTLYGDDGRPKIQWVKSSVDRERQQELIKEAIAAMAADLPKLPNTKKPQQVSPELMAVYPLGDPHIGVLSWHRETGQDWDLGIAEKAFCSVFDRLVKTAPQCAEAVIVNLGDYFHTDNMEGATTRSGHNLDTDGRYAKMVHVGVKIIRQMIHSALEHHQHVRVINAVGNHDDTGALFLSVCLANIYEQEPRVTVDDDPTPFHYVQWGRTMFGVHHGHSCKMQNLPAVMAAERAQQWGETDHRYWYTGHIHHDSMKEYSGCKVESFRTLAAKDAYATWAGYRSGQDSKCIVLDKTHGEVERHTVNLSMVKI